MRKPYHFRAVDGRNCFAPRCRQLLAQKSDQNTTRKITKGVENLDDTVLMFSEHGEHEECVILQPKMPKRQQSTPISSPLYSHRCAPATPAQSEYRYLFGAVVSQNCAVGCER